MGLVLFVWFGLWLCFVACWMRFLSVVTYLIWLFACGRMRCGLCFLITFVLRVVCVLLLFSLLLFDFGFRCDAIWGCFLRLLGDGVCCSGGWCG